MRNQDFNIPRKVLEKYNKDEVYIACFTNTGLENLKKKYRNVHGLPAFIHNTMKGRMTHDRALIFLNKALYAWTQDRSAIIIPNYSCYKYCETIDIHALKNIEDGGFGLVAWAMDLRLLKGYGWKKDLSKNNIDSFIDFLTSNKHDDPYPTFNYLIRTLSQEAIGELEKIIPEQTYLATILDLTPNHIPLLRDMKATSEKLLIENYNIDLDVDRVEMYFHFPYPDRTTTLHMHIRINQGRHPAEKARSFSYEEIIHCLEEKKPINELILERQNYCVDNFEILQNIDGIKIRKAQNPYKIIEAPPNQNVFSPNI